MSCCWADWFDSEWKRKMIEIYWYECYHLIPKKHQWQTKKESNGMVDCRSGTYINIPLIDVQKLNNILSILALCCRLEWNEIKNEKKERKNTWKRWISFSWDLFIAVLSKSKWEKDLFCWNEFERVWRSEWKK